MSATARSLLEQLADTIFRSLCRRFPVSCASDEFYFFPQVVMEGSRRWGWDDYSPASIKAFAVEAHAWDVQLTGRLAATPSLDDRIDITLLRGMLLTLTEQLQQVAPQRSQPTLHLNIVVAGLTEAFEDADPQAIDLRLAGLPDYLDQAGALLEEVPGPFLTLGQRMLGDVEAWCGRLPRAGRGLGAALAALQRYGEHLANLTPSASFLLPGDLFERLLTNHLGCGGGLAGIAGELEREYAEMNEVLAEEAGRLAPGADWRRLEAQIPFVPAPDGNLDSLYRPEVERLEAHARQAGLIPSVAGRIPPEVAEVPASMAAVRASDAYAARVGHPARGGVFFVHPGEDDGLRPGRSLEYRMTAAHETWPGHHLLDTCRWNLSRPVRRPFEAPLFYEGWACFAEELMARTGYFNAPWDRFLLARRRLQRAARGLVDLGLQTGELSLDNARQQLVEAGFAPARAANVVPKYALRPGYQTCYSLGLRRMLRLRHRCTRLDDATFCRRVLSQGEIGFETLEDLLVEGGG